MHIRFRNLKKNLLGEWRSGGSFNLPQILSQIRFPNWCHLWDEFAHFLSTPREFYLVLSMPRIALNQMQADFNKRHEVSPHPWNAARKAHEVSTWLSSSKRQKQ